MFQHQEKKASFSLSPDCSPLLKALRSPQTVAFLKGHQWPWFAKFFTNELDKGGQIKKCKQELNVPFASQLGGRPWNKINSLPHFRLTELVS